MRPPQLDFVHIEEEENFVNLVPIQVFYKYVEKLMYEIKDNSIGIKIRYLNENSSLKARKYIRKMRKSFLSTYKYASDSITQKYYRSLLHIYIPCRPLGAAGVCVVFSCAALALGYTCGTALA